MPKLWIEFGTLYIICVYNSNVYLLFLFTDHQVCQRAGLCYRSYKESREF